MADVPVSYPSKVTKADFVALATRANAAPESADIDQIVMITQAAYDALGTKDARTLYVING